jgi:heme/copper-type cytochrome/quinol oxidase subunit 4
VPLKSSPTERDTRSYRILLLTGWTGVLLALVGLTLGAAWLIWAGIVIAAIRVALPPFLFMGEGSAWDWARALLHLLITVLLLVGVVGGVSWLLWAGGVGLGVLLLTDALQLVQERGFRGETSE